MIASIFTNLVPPPQTDKQTTGNILDCPKVEGEEQRGDDEDEGEVICKERAKHVGQQSTRAEEEEEY